MPRDKIRRSAVKALTWRVLATLTTVALVYLFTENVEIAAGVGVAEVIVKYVIYYAHERTWNQVKWGKEL